MLPTSSRYPPRSNRPSHNNRTTHTAFTNIVRNTLDTPLPPTPPSPSLPSPYSSSPSSSSSNPPPSPSPPRFRNSAPLPHRSTALLRPSTPNNWHGDRYSAALTPPPPSTPSSSPRTSSSLATTLVDDSTRRDFIPPGRAFANAQESPPSSHHAAGFSPHRGSYEEVLTVRPGPNHSIAASSRRAPPYRPSQSAHLRRASAAPTITTTGLDPATSLPHFIEEMYRDLGVIAALPSLEPRDHLASIEAMNDSIAVWASANPVAAAHVIALAQRFRVEAGFEGTLGLGGAEEWMRRRGLSRVGDKGDGTSFAARVRRLRDEARLEKGDSAGATVRQGSIRGGGQRGEDRWRELPLVVVVLYSDVCGVDLTGMGEREGRAMLADWAGRYWPVSDERMLEVMMGWGGETRGKVDLDPRKWRREEEGKVERLIERIRGLGVGEVRRGIITVKIFQAEQRVSV